MAIARKAPKMPKSILAIAKQSEGNVLTMIQAMKDRAGKSRAILNRVIYPEYQKAQVMRWKTENRSETGKWDDLTESYLTWRQKKYPVAGDRIGLRSFDLSKSMTGLSRKHHFKLVTNNRLEVGSTLEYAKYFDEVRDITAFGAKTKAKMTKSLIKYIKSGDTKARGAGGRS